MSSNQENSSVECLLGTRTLLLEKFDEYFVIQTKAINEGKTVDHLDIMLDIEEKVFPMVAAELQKQHMRAMRKKRNDTEEEPVESCDRTEVVS